MKRLTTTLVLLFAAASFGRDKGNKIVEVKYDRFKDITLVSVKNKSRSGPYSFTVWDTEVGIMYSCTGDRTDCHPKQIGIFVRDHAGPQWNLIHVDRVLFLADGKRIEAQDVKWDGNASTGLESLSAFVSQDDFFALASASSVSLQAGPIERDLSEKERRGWREIADMAH
jgi:hypothetical protein